MLPAPRRGAQSSVKYEHDTRIVYCARHLKKEKKKNTQGELVESSFPSAVLKVIFHLFFRCFEGLQKKKRLKEVIQTMGLKLEMHDQCHRLNKLILTFLANFVKGQNGVRKVEFWKPVFAYCKITLTNSKVGICRTLVCEGCGHAFHSRRISEDWRNPGPDSRMKM